MSSQPRDEHGRFVSEPRQWWKVALDPFDDLYSDMLKAAQSRIEAANDAELDTIAAACTRLSTTNCAWTMYAVAEHVADFARFERQRREDAR